MKNSVALLLVLAAAAMAQSGISPPCAGYFKDAAGALRPLFGLAGSFVLGEPIYEGVQAAAFSGRLGLMKTGRTLLLFDADARLIRRWPAREGPVAVGFSPSGAQVIAVFEQTAELLLSSPEMELRPARPRRLPLDLGEPSGRVLSAGFLAEHRPAVLMLRDSLVWLVELSPAGVRRSMPLPDVSAPALLRPGGGIVFAAGDELVLREPDGAGLRLQLTAPAASLHEMGEGWIRVVEDGTGHLALRVLEDRLELYRLPQVRP